MKVKTPNPREKLSKLGAKAAGSVITISAEECRALCESVGLEYLDGYESRVLEYTLTDETVDRDGDIIKADGGDFANFLKNPVVLRIHQNREYPVGNIIKLWADITSKSVKGWVLFLDDRVDTSGESDRSFRYAKAGAMRAGSIGFQYREWKSPTTEERQALGMNSNYGWIITKWELLEFSVCPVPSNPNALSKAVKDGILTEEDAEDLQGGESPLTRDEVAGMITESVAKAMKDLGTNDPIVSEQVDQSKAKVILKRLREARGQKT